jgi:hypothetical protein
MSAADYDRWVSVIAQLLGMQRDIAQRQTQGPGTTKFR